MPGLDGSIYGSVSGPAPNRLMAPANPLEQAGQAVGLAQGLQNLSASQFELANKQLGAVNQMFGAIATDPRPETVTAAAVSMRNLGVPEHVIAAELGKVSEFISDPAKVKQWAFDHISRNMSVAEQLQSSGMAAPALVNTGDQLQPTTVQGGLRPGIAPAGGNPLPLAMSPEAKASPRDAVDPTSGQRFQQPASNIVDRRGYGKPVTPVPAPAGVPAASGAAAVPPRAAAPSLPPGGVVTGLPPGTTEAATRTGAQSGDQLAADRTEAARYRDQVFPLEQAIPALEKLGPTGTGPGTETINHIKSFALSSGFPGVDAEKIKNYDEAKKYLTDFVNKNGSTGTNDKLAAAFAGNPSTNISNAAAVDVAKSALALKRMQAAKVAAFDTARQAGVPEAEYGAWSAKWNRTQDPRAYGFDMMGAEAQKKLLAGMTDSERARFVVSLRHAHEADLLNARR